MTIEIKKVPQEFIFKKGDIVEIKGKLKSVLGKIDFAYYPTTQPDGELAYCFKYNEPFPQIGVRFEDGKGIHYNADDLIAGIVQKSDKQLRVPNKLIDLLKELKVDFSEAYSDLNINCEKEEEVVSLYDCCQERLLKFIDPILEKLCYYPSDTEDIEPIGEFDSHTYTFKSSIEGKAMRNAGVPAFTYRYNTKNKRNVS